MNVKKMILQTMLTIQLPKVFNWFGNNHMKANPGKCHLLPSTKSPEVVSIDGIQIKSSTAETLLGITIDSGHSKFKETFKV